MEIKSMTCPNCAAPLPISQEKIIECEYCKGKFNNPYYSKGEVKSLVNNEVSINLYVPERPNFNIDLLIILSVLYVFPGIIYLYLIHNAQKTWDEKYQNTKLGSFYKLKPKPQLSYIIFFFGLILYIIPGLIYRSYYRKRRMEWEDEKLFIYQNA